MISSRFTRREALAGFAAAPLVPAQDSAPDICYLSAREIVRSIRLGKLSARETLAAHLKQIERLNPKVNAIVTLVPEMAQESAKRADE